MEPKCGVPPGTPCGTNDPHFGMREAVLGSQIWVVRTPPTEDGSRDANVPQNLFRSLDFWAGAAHRLFSRDHAPPAALTVSPVSKTKKMCTGRMGNTLITYRRHQTPTPTATICTQPKEIILVDCDQKFRVLVVHPASGPPLQTRFCCVFDFPNWLPSKTHPHRPKKHASLVTRTATDRPVAVSGPGSHHRLRKGNQSSS
jgi:hypothetical protein